MRLRLCEQNLNIREVNAKIALLESIDFSDETRKLFKANWKTQRNGNL